MRFAGKDLSYYWQAIKWPVVVLTLWNIAGALVLRRSAETYMSIFGNQWLGFFLPIIVYLVAGYVATADYQAKAGQASWSGALTGFVVGVIGVAVLIVNFTPVVELGAEQAVVKAAEQGQAIAAEEIIPLVKVGTYISAVFSPFISGLFGALFGWLGHVLARKVEHD
ncbi:hypothetical protein GF367_02970 [Candidatus Woesearchaeota archaeon]|nr:hypothetical protein [Candidatus Woesearchaeota archaeon]